MLFEPPTRVRKPLFWVLAQPRQLHLD